MADLSLAPLDLTEFPCGCSAPMPPDGARSVIADILHALARRGDVQWWEAQALRDAAHLLLIAAAEEEKA